MDVQESLAQIDHIMTEVDLELYQWQTDLDMMSFIGQDVPLQLWTNDDPPMKLQMSQHPNLLEYNVHEVRVMHFEDGEWSQVGTAELDHKTGVLTATISEDATELREKLIGKVSAGDISINTARAQMGMTHPPFEGLNKPLTIRGLEEAIAKEETRRQDRYSWIFPDEFEKHPFFDKKEN